jgi:hypothetical protein
VINGLYIDEEYDYEVKNTITKERFVIGRFKDLTYASLPVFDKELFLYVSS